MYGELPSGQPGYPSQHQSAGGENSNGGHGSDSWHSGAAGGGGGSVGGGRDERDVNPSFRQQSPQGTGQSVEQIQQREAGNDGRGDWTNRSRQDDQQRSPPPPPRDDNRDDRNSNGYGNNRSNTDHDQRRGQPKAGPGVVAPPSNVLGVFGLSIRTTENDLANEFSRFGGIEKIVIIYDQQTQRSRGFGFVTMRDEIEAERCIVELNGVVLHGRSLRVAFSATNRAHNPTPGEYRGERRSNDHRNENNNRQAAMNNGGNYGNNNNNNNYSNNTYDDRNDRRGGGDYNGDRYSSRRDDRRGDDRRDNYHARDGESSGGRDGGGDRSNARDRSRSPARRSSRRSPSPAYRESSRRD